MGLPESKVYFKVLCVVLTIGYCVYKRLVLFQLCGGRRHRANTSHHQGILCPQPAPVAPAAVLRPLTRRTHPVCAAGQ